MKEPECERQARHRVILDSIKGLQNSTEGLVDLRDEIAGSQRPPADAKPKTAEIKSLNSFLSDTHIAISHISDEINAMVNEIREMIF